MKGTLGVSLGSRHSEGRFIRTPKLSHNYRVAMLIIKKPSSCSTSTFSTLGRQRRAMNFEADPKKRVEVTCQRLLRKMCFEAQFFANS